MYQELFGHLKKGPKPQNNNQDLTYNRIAFIVNKEKKHWFPHISRVFP